MKKKFVRELKPGTKVRYNRRLWIIDHDLLMVNLTTGDLSDENLLVTPVKITGWRTR